MHLFQQLEASTSERGADLVGNDGDVADAKAGEADGGSHGEDDSGDYSACVPDAEQHDRWKEVDVGGQYLGGIEDALDGFLGSIREPGPDADGNTDEYRNGDGHNHQRQADHGGVPESKHTASSQC